MAHHPSTSKSHRFSLRRSWNKQKGAALIFMAFILGLGAAVYVLKTYNADAARAKQDEKTYQALKDAKVALIAWAVNHPNTPGLMPYPDRNGDGNYDDTSDCYASNVNFAPYFTIGRLPLFKNDPNCVNAKSTVAAGLAGDFHDGTGERLWYEVSKNLLHDYKNNGNPAGTSPIINPSIINNPVNPWFVVRDRNGSIVSNRVAAVIIAPGVPIGDQDRSSGLAAPNQYLDKVVMADGTPYKNYTYQDAATNPTQEFIIGDDLRTVSVDDSTYESQTTEPYYFNDKLIYITIDELMEALEKRVGEELKANLKAYASLNAGNYPFAAVIGGVGPTSNRSYRCTNNNLRGALPIDNPADTCTYSATLSSVNSVCDFKNMRSVSFRKNTAGNFIVSSSACTISTTTCTCSGAGSCSDGTTTFSCDAAGNCSANDSGRIRFLGAGFDTTSFPAICSLGTLATCAAPASTISRTVTCNGLSAPVTLGYSCAERLSTLPTWFAANRWQESLIYELKRSMDISNITVGNKSARAVAITVGAPFLNSLTMKGAAQVRPSCNANDYLDSAENVSANSTYDATSKQRVNNYNDQIFVVSP